MGVFTIVFFLSLFQNLPELKQPSGLAYDSVGRLYVTWSGSNAVTVYNEKEEEITRWTNLDLQSPKGIAIGKNGKIYLCDTGNHRIVCLNGDGTIDKTWGKRGKSDGEFESPQGIALDSSGNVIIADTYNHRIQIFDSEGKFLKKFGEYGDRTEQFNAPMDVAYRDGLLYIASGWNSRIDIYQYTPTSLEIQHVKPDDKGIIRGVWVCASIDVLDGGSVVGLDSGNGFVAIWTPNDFSKPLKQFDGGNYGRFREPSSVAVSPHGKIAIADTKNNRILILDRNLIDLPRPRVSRITSTSAVIEWEALMPVEKMPKFFIMKRTSRHNGELQKIQPQIRTLSNGAKSHSIHVSDLEPGTGYVYRVSHPYVRSIGKDKGLSRVYSFATRPAKGEMTILNIPIAIIVRLDLYNPEGSGGKERGSPPPPEYLNYIRKEFADARLFYFINSHCSVNLNFDWYIYDKPLTSGQEFPPEAQDDAILRTKGKSRDDYASLVVVDCERRYDPSRKAYYMQTSGGGTWGAHYYGIEEKMQPGQSVFLGGGDLAWLFTHEFHHAFDSMFHESGFEEYPFNHFADYRSGGFPGPFGEHWDGNAYILRVWPRQAFFYNLFGFITSTQDQDEDGIPDNDSALPFDEKRWGSDPKKKSTGGDGIGDLQRLMFANWVPATLESINNAAIEMIRPNSKKTDQTGMGIPDKLRNDPCVPFQEFISYGSPDITKSIEEEREWKSKWGRFRSKWLQGGVYATWDETALYLAFSFDRKPEAIQIITDFALDGVFSGQDNYYITIECDSGGATIKDFFVHNGAQNKWPFADRELVKKESLRIASTERKDWFQVRLKIPWHLVSNLTLQTGDTYAFAFNFRIRKGVNQWNGDAIHLSAFEPYKLFRARLVK